MNDEHTMTKDDRLDGCGWLGIKSSLTAHYMHVYHVIVHVNAIYKYMYMYTDKMITSHNFA